MDVFVLGYINGFIWILLVYFVESNVCIVRNVEITCFDGVGRMVQGDFAFLPGQRRFCAATAFVLHHRSSTLSPRLIDLQFP